MKVAPLSSYTNIIDADVLILEPSDMEQYVAPQFRARALRFRMDRAGHEYLEIDGRPPQALDVKRRNLPGGTGRSETDVATALQKTSRKVAPFGAMTHRNVSISLTRRSWHGWSPRCRNSPGGIF